MKNLKNNYLIKLLLLAMIYFVNIKCTRDLSDDATLSRNSNLAEVFTDSPIGMGTDFYFPYGGSKPTAWTVDQTISYKGNASMRFDVPNDDDSAGTYAGAIFRVEGAGRDLTGYDSLTFWAKASQGVSISQFGFGEDFNTFSGNKYIATITNTSVGTSWKKYIIPIPDPSKLVNEKGMFRYAAGTQGTNGRGYTFWIDELKFEKLGTNALLYPFILNGNNNTVNGFIGANQVINQLGAVFNLANGQNISVVAAPAYFDFFSTNSSVTDPFKKNEEGEIFTKTISSTGIAVVTAKLGNSLAKGSLTINAVGAFPHAPIPTRNPSTVISLFSNAYNNVPVRHYNGFFSGSNTQGGAGSNPNNVDIQAPFQSGGIDNIIHYTQLDFVSIGMYDTVSRVNVSGMTHFHVDINVKQIVSTGNFIRLELHGSQPSGPTTSSGSFLLNTAALNNVNADGWASFNIPISSFSGFSDLNNLGQIFFVSGTPGGISNIWVDNVYFYAQ